MSNQRPRPRIPEIQFRVLIIGRANAGKTSLLQKSVTQQRVPLFTEEMRRYVFLPFGGSESDLTAD
jgi:GTPase SAR1 family protein